MKTESTKNRRLMQIIVLSLCLIGVALGWGSIEYQKRDWKQHMELVEEALETKYAE